MRSIRVSERLPIPNDCGIRLDTPEAAKTVNPPVIRRPRHCHPEETAMLPAREV